MKLLRKFALAWMVFWLPLSGAIATTMPFCSQGIMGMSAKQRVVPVAQQSDDAMPAGHCERMAKQQKPADAPCEHCDLCHLAGAMAPPMLPQIDNPLPPAAPAVEAIVAFTSFIPEHLQRPPRSSPA